MAVEMLLVHWSEFFVRSASCSALLTPADSSSRNTRITKRGSRCHSGLTIHFKQIKWNNFGIWPSCLLFIILMKNNICKWQSNATSADIFTSGSRWRQQSLVHPVNHIFKLKRPLNGHIMLHNHIIQRLPSDKYPQVSWDKANPWLDVSCF